jgi:hypothetical protein
VAATSPEPFDYAQDGRGRAPNLSRRTLQSDTLLSTRTQSFDSSITAAARATRYLRGAARPGRGGGASPATPPGALHPRDPRMLG